MNLTLFYVWEDARVWAKWNHSFDVRLNYLGRASWFSPSWIPSRCTAEGGGRGQLQWLMALWPQHPLFTEMTGDILCPQCEQVYIWISSEEGPEMRIQVQGSYWEVIWGIPLREWSRDTGTVRDIVNTQWWPGQWRPNPMGSSGRECGTWLRIIPPLEGRTLECV